MFTVVVQEDPALPGTYTLSVPEGKQQEMVLDRTDELLELPNSYVLSLPGYENQVELLTDIEVVEVHDDSHASDLPSLPCTLAVMEDKQPEDARGGGPLAASVDMAQKMLQSKLPVPMNLSQEEVSRAVNEQAEVTLAVREERRVRTGGAGQVGGFQDL